MKRSQAQAIKKAPGSCKLTVIETPTRDCICSDTGGDTTTIAYVAIGAESWGPLLAAAPDLLAACQSAASSIEQLVKIGRIPANNKGLRDALAAISKATGEPQPVAGEGRGKESSC